MPLREFDAGKNRQQREAAVIKIPDLQGTEHAFRRKRMTGQRFREILEQPLTTVEGDERSEDELTDAELGARARDRARQGAENVYAQIAQLIEPREPGNLLVDVDGEQRTFDQVDLDDQEDVLKEWLVANLDWDDAPALLNWLDELKPKPGNAGA